MKDIFWHQQGCFKAYHDNGCVPVNSLKTSDSWRSRGFMSDFFFFLKKLFKSGMIVHIFNLSTLEAEAEGSQ